MIAIDKAAEREKQDLITKEKTILEMQKSIEKAEERTHWHLNEIQQRCDWNKDQINEVFEFIIYTAQKRKEYLLQQQEKSLKREKKQVNERLWGYEKQKESIEEFF